MDNENNQNPNPNPFNLFGSFNPQTNQNPNQFPYQNPNQFLQFQHFYQHPNPLFRPPQLNQPTPSPLPYDPLYQGGSFQNLLNFGEFTQEQQSQEPFDDDDDVVPETQPEQMRRRGKKVAERRHKKKPEESPRAKGERKKWTEEEEIALSSSWASTSEDPILCRDVSLPKFWESVREKFLMKMQRTAPDYYRNPDSILSKWTDLKRKVKKFNGLMRQTIQTRKSGESDSQLIEEALKKYRLTMAAPFPHLSSWEILKTSPVCQAIPISGGFSKRSKTSESSSPATPISPFPSVDLNDSDDDELQMFEDDLPRPVGRDQAKAKARNKGTRKVASSSKTEELLELMTQRFGEFNAQ